MKAVFQNSYPKRTKNNNIVDVFVYSVDGTEAELEAYKDAKGAEYREDSETGKPLWFSLNYVGEVCPMIITTNGNVVADTSQLRKAANLVGQYDFLKEQLADRLLGQLGFDNPRSRQSVQTPINKVEDKTEGKTEAPEVENAGSDPGIDPFNI
jgi:hypothetical protein